MGSALCVRIREDRSGEWIIAVGDGGGRPVEARLDAPTAATLRGLEALPAPRGVWIRGRDAVTTHEEELVGRQLSRVLCATPGIAAHVAAHLATAAALGTLPVVLIDAPDPSVARLPWELLAVDPSAPPLEAVGTAIIARLGPSAHPRAAPSALGLTVHRERIDDDAIVATMSVALDAARARHGVERGVGAASIFEVVGHGEVMHDLFALTGTGEGAGTLAHRLGHVIRAASVAVFHVCHAAEPGAIEQDSLAARMLTAGVPAVVGSPCPVTTEGATAFTEGFYSALADGETIATAVARARACVRAIRDPNPWARWHNHRFTVSSADALSTRLVSPRLPSAQRSAESLLDRAVRLASTRGSGFLGLEHLVLALLESPAPGALAGRLARLLEDAAAANRRGLSAWENVASTAPPRPTPRLAAYTQDLAPDAHEDALLSRFALDPSHRFHALAGISLRIALSDSTATRATRSTQEGEPADGTPARIIVASGPEDGLAFTQAPGDILGRWDPDRPVNLPLFVNAVVVDRGVSRAHVEFLDAGQIRALRPVRLRRSGDETTLAAGAVATLEVGDLLWLGSGTWLLVGRGAW